VAGGRLDQIVHIGYELSTMCRNILKEKEPEAQFEKIKEIVARPPRTRNRKAEPTPNEVGLASPQSVTVKSDEAYSMLTRWWEASPADAKTRFKTFIDGGDLTQAA
jgi:hypothetical protein